ncbi:PREDICTED: stigma-specific STIG1-like protein 1 [Nelumbo nucifera]|uniref:Stigma-specific STIG1-like protein 1 n=2 Tax=Nelumbo nucifera TaxID=4432 RepID=A0A822XXD7_NELNU|nr:PREDICTED: stigma-specific STIG1-like protein 1 [Nelumbo nucifera]DAD23435.1 TPA_asm: hypothetical protein HUJ06_024898 [Nelumbo nucifera]
MKSLKMLVIILATMLALAIPLAATPAEENVQMVGVDEDDTVDDTTYSDDEPEIPLTESEQPSSLRGTSRFLAQVKGQAVMTCDKFPRVCRGKGSPGPDCCKKKCVNVLTDRLNCGMCGRKCKYSQICCRGECVNPLVDKKHCGQCTNKCKKGSKCVYGMCSYA